MKKFIFMLMLGMFCALSMSAQTNVYSHSKVFDNIDITAKAGALTTDKDAFKGHTACAPIIIVGADKYLTDVIAVGLDVRTMIGTGTVNEARFNSKTAFDAVNISGVLKANLSNLNCFKPAGGYKNGHALVDVKPYVQLGWAHNTSGDCADLSDVYADGVRGVPSGYYGSMLRNKMSFRPGLEVAVNVGKNRNFGIVLDASNVWGGIDNGRLARKNGQVEISLGGVWHLGTSNGTTHRVEPTPVVREVIREVPAKARPEHHAALKPQIVNIDNVYRVGFDQNSAQLSNDAKAILDKVPAGSKVTVSASASPEGSAKRNAELIDARAASVKEYLESRGVTVTDTTDATSARQAVVYLNK